MDNIIRVNMSNLTTSVEAVPAAWAGFGGRALTSTIVAAEVPPTCHPLGPYNKMVFAPGLLSGTARLELRTHVVWHQEPADLWHQGKQCRWNVCADVRKDGHQGADHRRFAERSGQVVQHRCHQRWRHHQRGDGTDRQGQLCRGRSLAGSVWARRSASSPSARLAK